MKRLVIVGAGIVGLSCAWSAQRRGWQVTLIERDFDARGASFGNAGGIGISECAPLNLAGLGLQALRWLIDPLGPLAIRASHAPQLLPWFRALRRMAEPASYLRSAEALAALNSRALQDLEAVLADLQISAQLHKRGALTVYQTQRAFEAEAEEWQLKRSLGVRWRPVDTSELHALEPALAPVFARAVMLEDWAHVDDPWRLVIALRSRLQALGATLMTGEATRIAIGASDQLTLDLDDGRRIEGERVVVAAGAWSASLAETLGDRVLLESERGYNTTLPSSAHLLNREVIFAERKFVATPLSVGLRVGGGAEFAGLTAPPNYRRSRTLLKLARSYLVGLDERGAQQWMGHRPATPDSLPVIGPSRADRRVLYAFGHGHLGLTQSATTAMLVADLLEGTPRPLDVSPYSITRFA